MQKIVNIEHGAEEIYCESSDTTIADVVIGRTTTCKCWRAHRTSDVIIYGLKDGTVDITIKNSVNDDEVTFKAVVTKPKDNTAKQKVIDYILVNGEDESYLDIAFSSFGINMYGFKSVTNTKVMGQPFSGIVYSPYDDEIGYTCTVDDSISTRRWALAPVESSSGKYEVIFQETPIAIPDGPPPEREFRALKAVLKQQTYDGGSLTFTDLLGKDNINEKDQTDANEFNKIAFEKIGNYLERVIGVKMSDLGFEKLS